MRRLDMGHETVGASGVEITPASMTQDLFDWSRLLALEAASLAPQTLAEPKSTYGGATRHRFKELKVWQKAMTLAQLTYRLCAGLPADERFSLIQQMRRAAVSIPSNIAEGSGRGTHRDFAHFLAVATGSTYELETQFLLAIAFGYLSLADYQPISTLLDELQRMLYTFRQTVLNAESAG